ncbi:GIDE domain-containing protein [Actinomadura sp. DC4]|uniref:GIDE domain-containing protein n=1 Tax=Actinomadura sp. DC4 TaxID=3055069 RepID=UPI0025AFE8CC|nr:GIDE domain-containing protein [Actinomadura sp. DC4]MDN3359728.1 GIDE domain-containing protein [Actinomadura sp. DC4]
MYALMTLLAAGVEAGAGAVSKRVGTARRRRAIHKAEPVTDATTGLREVSGRATAGPAGLIVAPFSGRSCVWYALTVFEQYHAWRPGPLGPTKVVRNTKAAEQLSGPLYVTGETVAVRVDARGAKFELGEPAFSAFEDSPSGPLAIRLAAMLGGRLRPRHRERTLGFIVEEHVVTADDPLYVVGQTRTELGDLVIGKPTMQPFIVSRTPAVQAVGVQD